jgi:hypothetical protein
VKRRNAPLLAMGDGKDEEHAVHATKERECPVGNRAF